MMQKQASLDKNHSNKPWSPFWIATLLGAFILLLVFIASSIDLVRIAISSQPECVTHVRVGESQSTHAMAAKSSC